MSTINQINVENTLYDIEDTQAREELLKKVTEVEGKGLSTNDFTDEDKEKLDGLFNYDDTDVREELNNKAEKTEIPSIDGLATEEYVDNAIANLPSGGGSSTSEQMELIASGTNTEAVRAFNITTDNDGNPFELTKARLYITNPVSTTNSDSAAHISMGTAWFSNCFYAKATATYWEVMAYADNEGYAWMTQRQGGRWYPYSEAQAMPSYLPQQNITEVSFNLADATATFDAGVEYELWGVRK